MRAAMAIGFLALSVLAPAAWAEETTATAVVCTGVENRTPQGEGKEFPATVGQLFCFSEVKNAQGSVTHVWFYGDKEVARVELAAKGPRFRTWSKKRIVPSQTGSWRVEVHASDGTLLAEARFEIK
ncbi:MAG: DUF2914 domain-containing protein [Thermoanaerobaculum sp.]